MLFFTNLKWIKIVLKFLFVHVNEWAPYRAPDTIPISTGYILSALKMQGFCGEILGDFKDRPLSPGLFRDTINSRQPLVVGFSTYAENIARVRFWARLAKHIQPQVLTVLGGPQVTFMPPEARLQMAEIDLLCRGDGEMVMPDLVRILCNGGQITDVPGLCYLAEGIPTETGKASIRSILLILMISLLPILTALLMLKVRKESSCLHPGGATATVLSVIPRGPVILNSCSTHQIE